MAGSKRARPRKVSIEDRHALGRLAEVIGSQVDIAQDFDWLNEKYRLEAQPTLSSAVVSLAQAAQRSRVDPRFRLLSLIEAAYRKGSFQYLLGELLVLYASRYSQANAVSLEAAQQDIIAGASLWKAAKKAAQLLGYEWTAGKNRFDEETVVVLPVTGGVARQEERDKLRAILEQKHRSALTALRGAYDAYQGESEDGKRQAVDSSRNAIENLVRDLTGTDLGPGIHSFSGDSEKRTRLLVGLRDFLGKEGTHAGQQPSEHDALLAIRMTEDAMIWILQKAGEW